MDAERWKQIDKLLHAVLEHAPEERDAFLRQACAGDERLEREARSLLTLEQPAKGFLETPAITESQGRFSPDSRYIAYVSNESGKNEVYVRSFSLDGKAGGQQMISQGGGSQPLWRRDGKELFYISADTKVMAVPVSTVPTFQRLGAPMALFTAPIFGGGRNPNAHRWAAMPNGQKFIVNSVLTEAASEAITVITNWKELLKK